MGRALTNRGHDMAMFNHAPMPGKLFSQAGLRTLPMPACPMPAPAFDLALLSRARDVEHLFGGVYAGEESVREVRLRVQVSL